MKLSIDLKLSIDENASHYFEKSKKAKKKLEGALEAVEKTKKKLDVLLKEKEAEMSKLEQAEQIEQKKKERKKEWYEKFRWFISSEGFLCIGGRDATTNEIVIKKHTESDDAVFHTDMAGSPFFVVKADSRDKGKDAKIGKKTLQECANATASFSRAWKAGLLSLDVFYVKPEQVTKEAQAGEYLTKGAFMIKGKTNYVEPKMEVGVSVDDRERIICGSVSAVETNKRKDAVVLVLKPGSKKPSDIAKTIKAKLKCTNDLDEIIRQIPAGNSEIIK